MNRLGKIKTISLVFWRLFIAILFYPLMIGLLIWLYIKDAHWIFGVAIIGAVLWFDRTWWMMLRRMLSWRPHNPNSRD